MLREEVDGSRPSFFTIESWRTIVEQLPSGEVLSQATIKIRVGEEEILSTGEGNGPVNAIDNALRKGLQGAFPEIATFALTDYKVRILEGRHGTDAITRVLVGTDDGDGEWTTLGVHANVIAASAMALKDALTYGLLRKGPR